MRALGRIALVALVSIAAAPRPLGAQGRPSTPAAVPTGKRTARPVATHVVIEETLVVTGGKPSTLLTGVPVAVKGPLRGQVKVVAVGPAQVEGTVDAGKLGLCVIEPQPLVHERSDKMLALLQPGALVRVLGPGKAGTTLVETAGPLKLRGLVATKALAPQPLEAILRADWQVQTQKPTPVFDGPKLAEPSRALLPEGTRLELLEQRGDVANVRTLGGVIVEGWVPSFNLAARAQTVPPPPEAQLVKPTHEVFVDAPVFADAAGKKRIGTLRGGALVEVNLRASDPRLGDPNAEKAGTVKVLTPSPVVVDGWVKASALRQLAQDGVPGLK